MASARVLTIDPRSRLHGLRLVLLYVSETWQLSTDVWWTSVFEHCYLHTISSTQWVNFDRNSAVKLKLFNPRVESLEKTLEMSRARWLGHASLMFTMGCRSGHLVVRRWVKRMRERFENFIRWCFMLVYADCRAICLNASVVGVIVVEIFLLPFTNLSY